MPIKVNEFSDEVKDMQENIALISDLRGGTRAMRKAAQARMPKRMMEENDDYNARLKVSTLFPALSETTAKMTGRVFQKPMIINDDVPEWIGGTDAVVDGTEDAVVDDIDMQGRSIHVYSRDLFRAGLDYGMTMVLVDSPPAIKADGTPIVSLADQKASPEVRPYAVHVSVKRLLGFMQDGNGNLIQLRITGERKERTTFGEDCVTQIWVYNCINKVTTLTKYEKDKDGEWQEVLNSKQTMDIDHIPLSVFYTNRTGFMTADPPLLELAHLNVKHWNKQSDADELIKIASVPILVEYGGGETSQITIGAKTAIKMGPQPGCKLEFCEHSGKAIEAGQKDLENLKQEMRDAGAKLLQRGQQLTNAKTATQVNEEAAADNSLLGAMVQDYEDFIGNVLDDFAAWRNPSNAATAGTGGTVKMQPNLDPDMSPIDSLKFLLDLANSGKYSDESLYEEAQKRGLVDNERPWQDELKRILSQPESQLPPPKAPGIPNSNPSIPNAGD